MFDSDEISQSNRYAAPISISVAEHVRSIDRFSSAEQVAGQTPNFLFGQSRRMLPWRKLTIIVLAV